MGSKQSKSRTVGGPLPVTLDGNQRTDFGIPETDFFVYKKADGKWWDHFCVSGNTKGHTTPACYPEELQWEPTKEDRETGGHKTCVDRNRKKDYDPDWPSGKLICMGSCYFKRCAHIYKDRPEVCPRFDNGRVGPSSATAKKPDEFDDQHGVNCIYSTEDVISSCTATREYTEKVREQKRDPTWFDDTLMTAMCSRGVPASECVHNYGDFKTYLDSGHQCSNMQNCSFCKEWAMAKYRAHEGTISDHVIDVWCDDPTKFDTKNPNDPTKSDPACRCAKRAFDPTYQKYYDVMTSEAAKTPAKCWYRYCTDPESGEYMVKSGDQTANPEDKCQDVCQQIIEIAQSEFTDISDIYAILNCGDAPGPGPEPPEPKPPGPTPSYTVDFGKLGVLCAAAAILGVGAIVLKKGLSK